LLNAVVGVGEGGPSAAADGVTSERLAEPIRLNRRSAVEITLTDGELQVLARHLGLERSPLLGDVEDELLAEGLRSLTARGLIDVASDPLRISSGLATIAAELATADGAVTMTIVSPERADAWVVVTNGLEAVAVVPVAPGVTRFVRGTAERLRQRVLETLHASPSLQEVYELTVVRAGEEPRSISWAGSGDGRLFTMDEEEPTETALAEVESAILAMLGAPQTA
jgi:hypothetical protein